VTDEELRQARQSLLEAWDLVVQVKENLWFNAGPSREARLARQQLVKARDYIAKARNNLGILLSN
jgi:hypothetical protein